MKLANKILSTQVREAVSDVIRKPEFMDKLPSGQDLAVQLGAGRNTVREASKGLENESLVISHHGIGMFVIRYNGSESIRYNISALDSTTKTISEHGYVPGTQSVFMDIRMADPEIPRRLDSDTPAKTLYIERVGTADGTPIIFIEDYTPYVDEMLEDFSSHAISSLSQFINRYAPISFANCLIHAVPNDKRQMDKLSPTDPKTLFLLQQIHYPLKGNSVFYSDSYFITEKLEFNLIRRCVE